MKLGLLTAAFPDTPLEEVAEWAAANGFSMLEVDVLAAGRQGRPPLRRRHPPRRAPTSPTTRPRTTSARSLQRRRDLRPRLLPQPARPRPRPPRRRWSTTCGKVIRRRPSSACGVVNTFIGRDLAKPSRRTSPRSPRSGPTSSSEAEDAGVKIGIENCPMLFSDDEWPGGKNLVHNPAVWRRLFGYLDGDTLGLNFDPSHLVWQFIDSGARRPRVRPAHRPRPRQGRGDRPGRPVRARGAVGRHGLAGARSCPASATCRWGRFFAALYQVGYDHGVIVEHEDRQFEGSDEKIKAGFLLARNAVGPYIV